MILKYFIWSEIVVAHDNSEYFSRRVPQNFLRFTFCLS